ncbi:unnamed protein product [Dibothriocephalus latus]|uniref:Uncharacterized protein n=1 Tax=Dibothriocephalus latus TaxID=60516 RepID=A0A3P7PP74_DIBLA|nr:unnamed protein product [Dibothriocephalus latus]
MLAKTRQFFLHLHQTTGILLDFDMFRASAAIAQEGAISYRHPNDLKSMKNGSLELPAKVENFKAWSSTALKCTKQVIEEKLGTTTPTRDPEIEAKVGVLK